MPMYDLACDACSILYEDTLVPIAERDAQACDNCGGKLRTVIAPVLNIGANWSKPIKVGTETYNTNTEFRAAVKNAESQGFGLVDRSDSGFKRSMDRMSTARERTAQAQGFRNEGHRQETWKRRRLEGKNP